jgi:hypothetical protein
MTLSCPASGDEDGDALRLSMEAAAVGTQGESFLLVVAAARSPRRILKVKFW